MVPPLRRTKSYFKTPEETPMKEENKIKPLRRSKSYLRISRDLRKEEHMVHPLRKTKSYLKTASGEIFCEENKIRPFGRSKSYSKTSEGSMAPNETLEKDYIIRPLRKTRSYLKITAGEMLKKENNHPPLRRTKSYLKTTSGETLKVLHTLHRALWFVIPMPYNIRKDNGEFEVRITENKTLYYFTYSLICIATVTAGVIKQTLNTVEHAEMQITVIISNIFLISIWTNKEKIVEVLKELAKMDYKFNKLGFRIEYKFYIYLVWAILIFDILLQIILRWTFLDDNNLDDYLHNFIYMLIGLSTSFYFYYIIVCLLLINDMLKSLNKFLKQTFDTIPNKMQSTSIKTAQKYYRKLKKIAQGFNFIFNIPIVIICGICIVNSVTALNEWWQQKNRRITLEVFQWIITHLVKMLILSIVCDNTKNEGQKITQFLDEIYVSNSSNKNKKHNITIFRFLLNTLHEKIEYWACGIFPINRRFIFTIVAVGAINSILLFQLGFDNKESIQTT